MSDEKPKRMDDEEYADFAAMTMTVAGYRRASRSVTLVVDEARFAIVMEAERARASEKRLAEAADRLLQAMAQGLMCHPDIWSAAVNAAQSALSEAGHE